MNKGRTFPVIKNHCLPLQGTQVRSLVGGLRSHMPQGNYGRIPQHKELLQREPHAAQRESSPLLTALGKAFGQQQRPGTCINKKIFLKIFLMNKWKFCKSPFKGFPGGASSKEPTCQCRKCKRWGFDPLVGKIPWRRAQQPTPVFLPGESHEQRHLAGYSP